MRATTSTFLFLFYILFALPALSASPDLANFQIWALDSDFRPVAMNISLGQFANYLKSHKAVIKIVLFDNDILEMRVRDPRMNLHEHIINTYVFELDRKNNRALCNHFLLNGREVRGTDLLTNTSFLFQIVAGQGDKFSSNYSFKVTENIPDATISDGDFYIPQNNEICGRILINLPVNKAMSFILLEGLNGSQPYFYLDGQCASGAPVICAQPLQKVSGGPKMSANGIKLDELVFIHQCRPIGEKN